MTWNAEPYTEKNYKYFINELLFLRMSMYVLSANYLFIHPFSTSLQLAWLLVVRKIKSSCLLVYGIAATVARSYDVNKRCDF